MKYVLIVWILFNQPVTMQEFGSQQACEDAKKDIEEMIAYSHKKYVYGQVVEPQIRCVPYSYYK